MLKTVRFGLSQSLISYLNEHFLFFFSEIKVDGVQMPMPKPQAMKEASASPVGSYYCTTPKGVDVGFFVFHFLFTKFNLPEMNMIEMLNDCNCRTCNLCRWKKSI